MAKKLKGAFAVSRRAPALQFAVNQRSLNVQLTSVGARLGPLLRLNVAPGTEWLRKVTVPRHFCSVLQAKRSAYGPDSARRCANLMSIKF